MFISMMYIGCYSFETSNVFGHQCGVNVKVKILILTASQSFKTVAAITANKTVVANILYILCRATIIQLCSFSICTAPACKLLLWFIGTLYKYLKLSES